MGKQKKFYPRYNEQRPEIKEQLRQSMHILNQHLNLGGEKNIGIEVKVRQFYPTINDIKTIQIIPLKTPIDAIYSTGAKGKDGSKRFFQTIQNRTQTHYFFTIDDTNYLIFYNPLKKN